MHTDSSGSRQIESRLKALGVNFKKEIPLCPGCVSGFIKADFAIYGAREYPVAVIEYDGAQHRRGLNTRRLEIAQANDQLKNEFCAEHDIALLRVDDPVSGTALDLSLVDEFIDGVEEQHPSIRTGVEAELVVRRSLNLAPVEYSDLTQYSYTVDEVADLINRQPRYVWDRYIIGLALIQNWSGHSFMSSFEESLISRYDLIRFLVDQEALFQNNELMTVAHPAVVFETGDRTEFYTTLIVVNALEEVGAALMELDVNLGHPIIYVYSSRPDRLYGILRSIQSGRYAGVITGAGLDPDLVREIDLVCDSARVLHHRQP